MSDEFKLFELYGDGAEAKEIFDSDSYFLQKSSQEAKIKVITIQSAFDYTAKTRQYFIINPENEDLIAYGIKNTDTLLIESILAPSEENKNAYKAYREKLNQRGTEETEVSLPSNETTVIPPTPAPSSETEVLDENQKKPPIPLKSIDIDQLDGLEEGGRYRLRYTDGKEESVTFKFYDTGKATAAFVARDNDKKIYYHAIISKDGELEWKKGEPEKAAEVVGGINLSKEPAVEKSPSHKSTPAPADAATKEEMAKKEPADWQKILGFVTDSTAKVIARGLTQSKAKRGTGELYPGQEWGGGIDKIANTGRNAIYGLSDNFSNSALPMLILGGLTTAGLGFGVFSGGLVAAGFVGGLIKATRAWNEKDNVMGALKNNTSAFDKVALSSAAVVGVGVGAVMVPPATMALTVVGAVLGAGYMMEKVFDNIAKGTTSAVEGAVSMKSALLQAREAAIAAKAKSNVR